MPRTVEEKALRGTLRKDRTATVIVGGAAPEATGVLTEAGRVQFDYFADILGDSAIKSDSRMLSLLAQACADYDEASGHIGAEGAVREGPHGPIKNPWLAVRKEATDRIVKLSALFGIDPASRARLPVPPKPSSEQDGFERYLDQGKPKSRFFNTTDTENPWAEIARGTGGP